MKVHTPLPGLRWAVVTSVTAFGCDPLHKGLELRYAILRSVSQYLWDIGSND
jgi:hypothetical protein